MAFRGFLTLGQTEIVNTSRTITYAINGVRNGSTEVVTDDSWPHLPVWLGRSENYRLPELDDDCPWYDPTESSSAEFAGVWPMSIEGLDATPLDREIIEGATVGGGFGVDRTPPRTVVVEAVLIARTPMGLQYGLGWLGSALRGDNCDDGARPRSLQFIASAPPFDAQADPAEVSAMATAESRLLSQVVQTGSLTVEETFSPWTFETRGACCARVSFELTAGVPWIWRNPTPLVSGLRPSTGTAQTVRFENVGPGGALAACDDDLALLTDPLAAPLSSLPRPISPAASVGLQPLQSRRLVWALDAGRLPRWADTVPTVTVTTGPVSERSIRLQWIEGVYTGDTDVACSSVGEAMIAYLPANSTCTLDAVTGEATVVTSDGRTLDATPVTTGRWGGPWRSPILRCAQTYTLVIDTMQNVHNDVQVSVNGLVRQP